MKALVLKDYMRFSYENVPEPDCNDDDALVRVKATGICGSDVHGMDGSTGRRQPPIIMGHEAAGIIAEVGKNVTEWKKGDRVTFDSTVYLSDDWYSRRGEFNLSDNREVLGVSCDEYRRDGAFAEYVAVPQHILYRLPDKMTFEQAAMVEVLSVAFHAVERTPIFLNDTAVVVGTGIIGLLLIQILRIAGCSSIIAVDIDREKLAIAQNLGADVVLSADSKLLVDEIRSHTHNRGADFAFEAVGIDPTVNMAVESVRKGGAVTLVGNLAPAVNIPLQEVVTRQLTLVGSCASSGEYPTCIDMIAQKIINVDALISATAPLSVGASWFERLYNKEPGLLKVILIP